MGKTRRYAYLASKENVKQLFQRLPEALLGTNSKNVDFCLIYWAPRDSNLWSGINSIDFMKFIQQKWKAEKVSSNVQEPLLNWKLLN